MRYRVFVAIPVPEEAKRLIAVWQRAHTHIPVRWIKPENLHITLVSPWYVSEDELYEAAKAVELAVGDTAAFEVNFERVLFGPPGRPPRLIWAEGNCLPSAGNLAECPRGASKFPRVSPRGRNEGETPEEFKNLKIAIEKALLQNPQTGFLRQESRPAKLHLTLARFRTGSIRNPPQLEEKVTWNFEAEEVTLIESALKRSGAEYTVMYRTKFPSVET